MLPGIRIPQRRAEPRLDARPKCSNITMHVSAANAKQPIISHYVLHASHSIYSFGPHSQRINAVGQDCIDFGSPFVTTHSTRGENSIDLDLPTLSANRCGSMPCESHAQY
jgi:hypothetical protein